MRPPDDALLAWPARGRPVRRKAFLDAVADAAARLDWPTVAAALSRIPAEEFPGRHVATYLLAAQRLCTLDLLERAVAIAIAAPMPPRRRIWLASQLALADHPAPAWRLLKADPATLTEAGIYSLVMQVLRRVAEGPRVPAPMRAEAAAVLRRYSNRAPVDPIHAPHVFAAGPGGARPGPGPAAILPAPGVPAVLVDAYRNAVDAFEVALQARPAPVVTELRDVFVNRLGQIWRPDGTVVADRGRLIPEASWQAAGNAESVPEAVLALETHNNIYHWLADCLTSVAWRLEPGAPDMPLLIRDDPAPFVPASLEMAGVAGIRCHAVGAALHVERLYRGASGLAHVAPLGAHRRLIETIAAAADAAPPPPGGPARRLYISRRDARRQPMTNELVLEEALAGLGFTSATFSPLALPEQMRRIRDAEVIVAPHGAALGMLLFGRPETAVFEIMPGRVRRAPLTACMARASRLIGHRHAIWLEELPVGQLGWTVNLPAMLRALAAFIDGRDPLR